MTLHPKFIASAGAIAALISLSSVANAQTPPVLGGDCQTTHTKYFKGTTTNWAVPNVEYDETWVRTHWDTLYDRPVDDCPTNPCTPAQDKKYGYNIQAKTTKTRPYQEKNFKHNLWELFLQLIGLPKDKQEWESATQTDEVFTGANVSNQTAYCGYKYIFDMITTETERQEARANTQEAGIRNLKVRVYTSRPAEWNTKTQTYNHCTGQYELLPPPPPTPCPPAGGANGAAPSAVGDDPVPVPEEPCTAIPCIAPPL